MDGQPVVNLFHGGCCNIRQQHGQGGMWGGRSEPRPACGSTDFHGKVICFSPLYESRQQDSALSFHKSEAGMAQADRLPQTQCQQPMIQLFHGGGGDNLTQCDQWQDQRRGRPPCFGREKTLQRAEKLGHFGGNGKACDQEHGNTVGLV